MFKIDKLQDTFSWVITVKIPNNGQYDKFNVKVKYHRLPYDETEELLNKIAQIAGGEGDELSKLNDFNRYQDEMLDKVFAGWEKGQITDENGEVEPDAAGIAKVLQITEFRKAVIDGYQASQGGEKVKTGN